MNISQPEPEDPALTPVHASDPSPTELLKAALSSDAPLAERFSPHEFAAAVSAAHADGDAEADEAVSVESACAAAQMGSR